MIRRPLSRWSCRGFRASSPSSRPSRSKSATDGTSSVAISPRRGAMPSSAAPSSTGCAPSSPKATRRSSATAVSAAISRPVSAEHFAVDETRVAEDARFDGLYVLRTNTKLTPLQVMLRYRDLLRVEQLFRQAKAVLATRPIYHSSDMAIRGHVFCSFLALLLVKELEDRLHRHNIAAEWDDILRDLDRLQEIELEQDGKRFLLRTPTTGVAGKLFQAVGVALPPNLQELPLTTPQPAA